MSVSEIISSGGITLIVILSLIQIAPIKVNPWSTIARFVGRSLNVELREHMDLTEAETARYRIIRFADEIRHDVKHTEEHFNQILDDIKKYEDYCKEHPKYPNNKAVSSIEKIKRVYEKCSDENSFL